MSLFFIDNSRFDGRLYSAEPRCAHCKLSILAEDFYKDGELGNMPYYFQVLDVIREGKAPTAVMFCGAAHCNEWSFINKDKIWNRRLDFIS